MPGHSATTPFPPNEPAPAWPHRLAGAAAFLLAASVIFAFSFTPLRSSHDEWWHLKSGKYIAEHGLPENDVFAYTSAKIPWDNHEWLSQILMWKVYLAGESSGFGGLRGVIALKTAFILAAFLGLGLWLARRMTFPAAAALVCAVAAALSRRTFYPRPPFVSYLFIAILIALLCAWRAGKLRGRWLCALPPLFALWSNMHGGWLAGLVVGGCFWLDCGFDFALRRALNEDARPAARRWGAITLAGLASAAATLCNPYGAKLWLLAGRVMNDPYLVASIGEMMPPDRNFVWVLPGTAALMAALALRPLRPANIAATLAASGIVAAAWWLAPSPWLQSAMALILIAGLVARVAPPGRLAHFVMALFFLHQGIHHVRQLPLSALALMPLLAWGLDGWARALAERSAALRFLRDEKLTPPPATLAAYGTSAAMLLAMAGLAVFWWFGGREWPTHAERVELLLGGESMQKSPVHWKGAGLPTAIPPGLQWAEAYPAQACDFMLAARLPGPIFNGGNYAGYLIWRLSPEYAKVFTDNRYDIYGGRFLRQEHAVLGGYGFTYPALLRARYSDRYAEYFARRYDLNGDDLPAQGEENDPPPTPRTAAECHALGFFAWGEILDHWGVQTALVPPEAGVNFAFAESGKWKRVYEDVQMNIWVRESPQNAEAIARAAKIKALPPEK